MPRKHRLVVAGAFANEGLTVVAILGKVPTVVISLILHILKFVVSYEAYKLLCFVCLCPSSRNSDIVSILRAYFPQQRWQFCRELVHKVSGCPLKFGFSVICSIHDDIWYLYGSQRENCFAVELSLWWGRGSPVRSCDHFDRTTQQQALVIVVVFSNR